MSVKGSDLTVVGTSSPVLAVSTGGGSTTAATFAGAGNAHGVTISGGGGSSVSALVVTAAGANPGGGVGITVTCGASTTTGANAINATGGSGGATAGVGLNVAGNAPTTGPGSNAIVATGGNGTAGNVGGHGVRAIGGNGQGSGSAGVGVIGQGGVHGAASGSRQSGIGLSGSGNASGSGGWFVGGDKGGHAVVAYAGLSTDNGVGGAYVVSGAFASASLIATETHLILSSSAGSVVHVSGALQVRGATGTGSGKTVIDSGQIHFTSSAAALFTRYGITSPYFGTYNVAAIDGVNNTLMAVRCGNTVYNTYAGGVWEWFSDLSVDGITAAKIRLSASSKANTAFIAPNGHLILSSSVTGSIVAVSGNLKVTTHVIENATQAGTTVDTTAVVIDNFLTTDYRAMKYVITVSSGSSYQAQEMFVLHSGTSTTSTTYAQLSLPGNIFCGFTASITGSTLNIIASGSSPGNTVKFIRNAVVI